MYYVKVLSVSVRHKCDCWEWSGAQREKKKNAQIASHGLFLECIPSAKQGRVY